MHGKIWLAVLVALMVSSTTCVRAMDGGDQDWFPGPDQADELRAVCHAVDAHGDDLMEHVLPETSKLPVYMPSLSKAEMRELGLLACCRTVSALLRRARI